MKTICIVIAFLFSIKAFAQVPQGIPYQAIARNGQGQAIANLSVKVRFSILDSLATGPAVYIETHMPTTSPQGLFSVNVGMGTSSLGTFSAINWGVNSKFLKVELDTTATGNNYVDLGTQQMMSVPYALYAGGLSTNSYNSISNTLNNISNQGSSKTFWQALNYCATLTESGFSDWRLPSIEEVYQWITTNGTPTDGLYTWTKSSEHSVFNDYPSYYVVGIDGTTLNGYTNYRIATTQNIFNGTGYPQTDVHFQVRCIR